MALNAAYRERILSRLPASYRKEYQEGVIDDAVLEQFAAEVGIAAPEDFSNVQGSPSFSNVQGESRSTEDRDPLGYDRSITSGLFGAITDPLDDSLLAGLASKAGDALGLGSIALDRPRDMARALAGPAGGSIFDALGENLRAQGQLFGLTDEAEIARLLGQSATQSGADYFDDVSQRNRAEAEAAIRAIPEGALRTGVQGVSDVVGSPESLASIPGGLFAAIPGVTSYARELRAGLEQDGMMPEEAGARARLLAGGEAAISALPAGSVVDRLTGGQGKRALGSFLRGSMNNILGTTVKTAAGEVGEEVAQDNLAMLTELGLANFAGSSEGAKALSEQNLPDNPMQYWERVKRSAVAGAIGGGALGGGMAAFEDTAAAGRLAAEALRKERSDASMRNLRELGNQAAQRQMDRERSTAIEPTQGTLFGEPSRELPSVEEQVAQRERNLDLEASQIQQSRARAREREIAYLTREREQIRANSNQYTMGQDFDRINQIDTQIAALARQDQGRTAAPVEQATPVQRALPIGQSDIPTVPDRRNEIRAQRNAAVAGVTETLNKQDTAIQNSAKSKRAADKRKFMQDFLVQNKDVPREELVQQAADAQLQWEASNPIENYVTAAQNAPAPRVRPSKGKKGKKLTTEEKTYEVQSTLDNLLSGLSSEADAGPTGVTSQQAVQALVDTMGKGDSRLLAKTLVDGNMEIVNNASEIPSGAVAAGTAGYYDGKKMYIVASQLDSSKPLVGQMMSIASHEVTHAGDVSGKVQNALVGPENNARIVRQIEEVAKKTPELQALVDKAGRVSGGNSAVRNLELTAYFAQRAEELAQSNPAIARVAQNLVSAVRVNAKKYLPGDFDVNLADVGYLARDLLTQAALKDVKLSGNLQEALKMYGKTVDEPVDGLATIGGRRALDGFEQAFKAGKTYKGKVDNLARFEIPDNKAKLLFSARNMVNIDDGFVGDFEEIVANPEVFKAYPSVAKLRVIKDSSTPSAFYSHDHSGGPAIVVGDAYTQDNHLKETLLHEAQHHIQRLEGFVLGSNMEMFIPAEAQLKHQAANDRLENFVKNFEIGRAVQTLAPNKKQEWTNIVREYGLDTRAKQAQGFMSKGMHKFSSDRMVQRYGDKYAEERDTYNNWVQEYNKIRNKAFAIYLHDYGEAEARAVEARSNYDDERLANETVEETMGLMPISDNVRRKESYFPVQAKNTIRSTDFRNNPEAAPVSLSAPQGLASIADEGELVAENPRAMGKMERAAKRLLLPGGGFGRQLEELLRHAGSLPASLAARGTHLGNQFLTEMKTHAALQRVKEQDFRDMIGKRIEAIDALETRAERKSAVAALDREYPGIGRTLEQMREFKLGLTIELINLRRRDPKPMDEKEFAIYQKMATNAERYTTRAYLATYNEDIGRSYGKYVMDQYKQDPTSEKGKIVADALQYLVENELTIPDTESMESMKMPQLRRIYEAWIGNASKFKGKGGRKAMIAALEALPAKTSGEIDAKALEVVNDMLGLSGDRGRLARQFTPSMRQNRTILQARTDLPDELRKLLGEITDPFLRESMSLNRMINLSAKTKFLTEVFEQGNGEWFSDTRNEKFNVQINSPSYGPLDGKWISQDLEDAITGSILSMNNIDSALSDMIKDPDAVMQAVLGATIPAAQRIMSIQKTWNVVASMFNMVLNFAGAVAVGGPSQGIINLGTYAKGMAGAAKTLALEVTDRLTTEGQISGAEELIRAGVTDSATMGEFKSQAYQAIVQELSKLDPAKKGFMKKAVNTVWKGLSGQGPTANAIRQVYAFMDVWVKAATYYDRKNFLTAFNEAEGMGWTDEYIQRRAGYEAAGTNISYERAIPLAKIIERNVPLAMFLTYFSEVPRAMGMSLIQGYRDLEMAANAKTAKGKALAGSKGMLRITGTLAATGGIIAGTLAALDSEDEEEKKRRMLDADYMQDVIQIPLGKDAEGNEIRMSLNRVDPYGPLNEFVIKVARSEDKIEGAAQAVKDLFVPSTGWISVARVLADAAVHSVAEATGKEEIRALDMRRRKDGIIERNYPNAYKAIVGSWLNAGDVGENAVTMVESLFIPSSFRPTIDDKGKVVSDSQWVGDIPRQLGAKPYARDPDKSLMFRHMDYKDKIKVLQEEKKDMIETGTLDAESIKDLRDREYEAFQEMSEMYDAYLSYPGVNREKANKIIDNKTLAARLRTGQFKSGLTDVKLLDEWRKKEKKNPNSDPKKVEQTYRLLRKLYSEVE